ncbi:MAG TPA: hypothetical protein VL282_14530, partial [Tepidisphaeraceae bacterium]|nr:hypothetical protein [Tepidisphaeraceae bacterium]
MKNNLRRYWGITAFVVLTCAAAQTQVKKKLVGYGWDWPNTAYVRAHIREMERRPFDGIVIAVSSDREPKYHCSAVGTQIWGKT